jgi:hypothetical protein
MAFLFEGVITSNSFLQHHENGPPQQSPHILQPHFSPHESPLYHNSPHRQRRVRLIILLTSIFLHLLRLMAFMLLRLVGLQACISVRHPLDDQLTWRGSKRPEKKKERQKRTREDGVTTFSLRLQTMTHHDSNYFYLDYDSYYCDSF